MESAEGGFALLFTKNFRFAKVLEEIPESGRVKDIFVSNWIVYIERRKKTSANYWAITYVACFEHRILRKTPLEK